jgi:hypothetical protein
MTADLVAAENVAGVALADAPEVRLSSHDLEMIRRQVIIPKGVRAPSDVEVSDFGEACMVQRLNPFDRQIYFAFIGGRWTYFIGVHGRLTIALRTGQVAGMEGPYYCHKREGVERAHPPDWDELWDDDDPPHAAKFVVYRKGWTHHPVGVAPWRLYGLTTDQNGREKTKPGPWAANPVLMLGYKAITRALNLVFPDVMPPDTGRDDEDDVDESVAYSRDEATVVASGVEAAREAATQERPPASPSRPEFIVPTPEQVNEINRLLGHLDLSGAAMRAERMAEVSRALGHDVWDTRELDRTDAAQVIEYLRDRWYERTGEEPF